MIGSSDLALKSVFGRRERTGRRIVFLAPLQSLGQVEAWRLRLAYFTHGEGRVDDQPDFEIGFRCSRTG